MESFNVLLKETLMVTLVTRMVTLVTRKSLFRVGDNTTE